MHKCYSTYIEQQSVHNCDLVDPPKCQNGICLNELKEKNNYYLWKYYFKVILVCLFYSNSPFFYKKILGIYQSKKITITNYMTKFNKITLKIVFVLHKSECLWHKFLNIIFCYSTVDIISSNNDMIDKCIWFFKFVKMS